MDSAEFQELVPFLDQFTVSRYLLGTSDTGMVRGHQRLTYLSGASFVLSVYDWLLLFGDGVLYLRSHLPVHWLIRAATIVESVTIWRTRWTLPKGIYYFVRHSLGHFRRFLTVR
jgi:Family of unknown function (DUF6533)